MTDPITSVQRDSVQVLPDARKNGNGAGEVGGFWADVAQRGYLLPAWGTRAREKALRRYYRHELNTLTQGAFMGLVKKVKATPWELSGGRNLTRRFQGLFRDAQFGAGWGQFLSLVILDYLRFDGGAYVEVIAPGDPLRAPTGAATGLAHLDAYRCLPTGDPVYPVVYYDRAGKLHLMHYTRVLHFVDMPDGDQDNPGYGLCALSRAIAVVERQLLMGQYIISKLDDKPPPGMLLVGGMTETQWTNRWSKWRTEQTTDERPDWGKVVAFFGADADHTPEIESIAFAQTPDKFDYKVYVELDVHMLALALGVDIQELWELTSGQLGSAGQSEIQHAKSQGRAYGDILTMLERGLNDVVPESLEFQFKVRDPFDAQAAATNAQTWAGFVNSAGAALTPDEKRQILANQVEAVADAILDENGELIRLDDADPKAADEVTAMDSAPNAPAPDANAAQVTAQDAAPLAGQPQAQKDYEDTRSAFVLDFTDLVQAANQDDITRRRAGTVLRAQLNRYGKQAREDGLKQGGVEDGLSEDDLADHAVWLAEQSGYVTDFLNGVFADGLTDAQIAVRAEAWANKSLSGAYYGGTASADANGLYEFVGGDGEQGCTTCKKLKGQTHRMKDWTRKALRPGLDTANFDCGGWNCDHSLQKTSGRASGNWLN